MAARRCKAPRGGVAVLGHYAVCAVLLDSHVAKRLFAMTEGVLDLERSAPCRLVLVSTACRPAFGLHGDLDAVRLIEFGSRLLGWRADTL